MKELKYKKYDKIFISASKINLFYECPRKYFYRYLYEWKEEEKIKQVSWPGSGFGDSIHKILEWCSIKLMEGLSQKEIMDLVKGKFKDYYDIWLKKNAKTFMQSKGYSYKKFVEKGEKYAILITKFYMSYFTDFTEILPEEEFEIKYDLLEGKDVYLKGIIDLVYFSEDDFKIIDFKTTKESTKFYFVDWRIDTQSLIYLYYCLQKYNKFPSSFSYLVLNHMEKTLFFKEQFIEEKETFFRNLTDQIDTIYDYTKNPDFELSNSSASACKWCEYKGICELKHTVEIKNLLKRKRK